jgi:hypothetical protein
MKIISLLSVLASLGAGALLPLRLEIVAYFGFTAAIGCIWAQDYSARRLLRFERTAPTASQFTARFFFHRPAAAPRATFRAPALTPETNRLAA